MGDLDITIGANGVKKRLKEVATGVYADYVYVSGIVADVDLDIEASDLGAGAEGASCASTPTGVLMQGDAGNVRKNLTLDSSGNLSAVLAAGSSAFGTLVMPAVPAETVVAGAASTLGKIGTVAAAATVYVRCPCASSSPASARVLWRISSDKAYTTAYYVARSILNCPTITLASAQANDTVAINGLTFTAHTDTTTVATRNFSISGDDTADAHELCVCINDATYGVPGVTADHALGVVTLTATTATTTQCVTGVGGARIVCAQGITTLIAKQNNAPAVTGAAANSTTSSGTLYEQVVDGFPHAYLALTNADSSNAATFIVGATCLAW